MRGKNMKIFQEIAQRHMSISLIFMQRYDEAERIQLEMEQQGTKTLSERSAFTWDVRYALLHYYKAEYDLSLKHARATLVNLDRMTTVWFIGIYFFCLTVVVRESRRGFSFVFFFLLTFDWLSPFKYLKLWKHYRSLHSDQKILDISTPLTEEQKKGAHAEMLKEIQESAPRASMKFASFLCCFVFLIPTSEQALGGWLCMVSITSTGLAAARWVV